MGRTQRADPRETGKFSKPRIRKSEAPRIKQFERASGAGISKLNEGKNRGAASLGIPIGQIPGVKQIATRAMYCAALEVAKNQINYSSKDEASAVAAVRRWKRGQFIGTKRMQDLGTGFATPDLEEIRAIYSATGENTNTINSLAYLIKILMQAARAEEQTVSKAAKECLHALGQKHSAKA